ELPGELHVVELLEAAAGFAPVQARVPADRAVEELVRVVYGQAGLDQRLRPAALQLQVLGAQPFQPLRRLRVPAHRQARELYHLSAQACVYLPERGLRGIGPLQPARLLRGVFLTPPRQALPRP